MARVRAILAAGDPPSHGANAAAAPTVPDVSREARGLAIVLLYGAYENLLRAMTRGLLETAKHMGASNRHLRPGFQVSAVFNALQSTKDTPGGRVKPKQGLEIVTILTDSKGCTISSDWFPDDGSHMKRSQVASFCAVFGLGEPGPILREAWGRLDGIVDERNAVAHGRRTPDEIGRSYTRQELVDLVDLWEARWLDFIRRVERGSSRRRFFLSA
jgi:RiboL-PSP-HEPN